MNAVLRAAYQGSGTSSRFNWKLGARAWLTRFLGLIVLLAPLPALASDADRPVLSVRETVDGDPVTFTREQLADLGIHRIETDTPWTDKVTVFEGPLLRDVLAKADVDGQQIEAVALNDYRVDIPVSDSRDTDMILAMKVDGKTIGVRERGPLWVIYPWGVREDLRTELYYSRAIWQLRELILRP
jgi:hypothetical protein